MFLEKISWVQAQEYFEKRDIAIIPVGSTEVHGTQSALGTDYMVPAWIAEKIADNFG